MEATGDNTTDAALAGAASVREGTFPHGELGVSSCSSIFAAPQLMSTTVFALGEGCDHGFNKVAGKSPAKSPAVRSSSPYRRSTSAP